MYSHLKKPLLLGGLAMSLTFGGLAGCGDGVDQDNGPSDGQKKDAIDNDTKKKASKSKENVDKALKEDGIGDGVDQDNGISDGEKKDEQDNK
ncbi:hypothetical protein [Neobacillus soli]|uniref:hypothetical protein n=1 Tax=Neobacillus soli TaxID=220688 RepID=UPI0008245206|nr:hypothetical protein [Neobacillus soli]